MTRAFVVVLGVAIIMAASITSLAAADNGKQPGFGPNPQLPKPDTSLVPTINVARAVGWTIGEKPSAPSDLAVTAYATALDHPRWIYTLPNGDVLVAETNGPQRPQDGKGLKAWFAGLFQTFAGAHEPSPNRIILLRGVKADGSAEARHIFLEGISIRRSEWLSSATRFMSPTPTLS